MWYHKTEMTLEQKLDKLPPYLYCDEPMCKDQRHYLTFNRDIQGKWCVGYVEFLYHTGINTGNSYDTLEAAIDAVAHELHITLT